MQFRYARHTNDLEGIIAFYTQVIGLQVLGSFENHADYSGVFLGFKDQDWHLEFTVSSEKAQHFPDPDDLLVFYVHAQEIIEAIRDDAERGGYRIRSSKNPYWQRNGLEIVDPDGFSVVIALKEQFLEATDELTLLAKEQGVGSWNELLTYIRHIPYGRNVSRSDLSLVFSEYQGTCSSKHALVQELAQLNQINQVELVLSIYKMKATNTPGIGHVLEQYGFDYLPEAHCYLRIHGKRIDLTNPNSKIANIESDIIEEHCIDPTQVVDYKVEYHKTFMSDWLKQYHADKSFATVWKIRELCIAALSGTGE